MAPRVPGWRATLERDGIAPGTRSIGALVLRAYGLVEVLEPLAGRPIPTSAIPADIEEPLEGAVIAGNLVVRGWFLSGRGYDTVEVVIAGAEPVRARLLCSPRPALAASVADPDAPLAGWELLVPFDATRAGESTVIVDIDGPRGRRRLGERTVQWLPAAGTGVAEPERAAVIEARTARLTAAHRPDGEGLNLLVAAHHLGLGGGQLYLQELLRHLLREPGVTCTVLASVDGALRDELEALGASVHIVGDPTPTAVPYEHWLHQVAALATTTTANAVLANTVGSYWGVDLAARLGIPSVWAVHESWSPELIFALTFSSLPDDAVRKRFLQAFRQAGAVVFEAEATKRIFEPFMPDGRGLRIDYGIDLERVRAFAADTPREQLRARLGVQPGQVLLLCMGTYEPRKAQGVLTTAFARIAEEHPWAVLALVGDKPGELLRRPARARAQLRHRGQGAADPRDAGHRRLVPGRRCVRHRLRRRVAAALHARGDGVRHARARNRRLRRSRDRRGRHQRAPLRSLLGDERGRRLAARVAHDAQRATGHRRARARDGRGQPVVGALCARLPCALRRPGSRRSARSRGGPRGSVNVGVTGASGFLGSLLVEHIASRGHQVRALTRALPASPATARGGVGWVQGDLGSPADAGAFAEGLDTIIHLAWTGTPLTSNGDLPGDPRVNMLPTLALLDAVRASGRRPHVIFASSGGALYGPPRGRRAFRESDECDPRSGYGIEKLAIERYLRMAATYGWLTATALRMGNPYGVLLPPQRMQGFIGTAVSQLRAGDPVRVFGNLANVRDFVHVSDVCRAFELALTPREPFDVLNIGSGAGHSVQEVLALIEQLEGRPVAVQAESPAAAEALPSWVVLDVERARVRLGWSPATPLRDGLGSLLAGSRPSPGEAVPPPALECER